MRRTLVAALPFGLASLALADAGLEPYLPVAKPGAELREEVLREPVRVITDKPRPSPTGDPHEYISYARYWWPDPSKPDGLPYINRDGHHNEKQVALGDEPRIGEMDHALEVLSGAWLETHDPKYARRAGEWIRAWFITPDTRMNPDLEFAQIQLGRNHNHGNNTGVLDGRGFARVVDALRVLHGSPAFGDKEEALVQGWFHQYGQWLTTAANAKKEHEAPNNHGSWYLAQAIPILRYGGDEDAAKALCEEDKARIDRQIRPDGEQPAETRREDGLGYSVFNLQAQWEIATQAKELGIDLWTYQAPGGGSLRKGLDFLRPYNQAPSTWPGKELKPQKPGFLDVLISQGEAAWGAAKA